MSSVRNIRVRLLGRPAATWKGRNVEFPTRKTGALLFHLAAAPGQRAERRHLSGLLWSDAGEEQAAASLRKVVSHLSRAAGTSDLVDKDRNHVWFAGDPFETDLALFNRCLETGTTRALRQALELWRGEPLAGLETGSELFDEWMQSFRSETVDLAHRHLSKRLAALPEGQGDRELERAVCELIARIEPTDTAANARMIRAMAAAGDIPGATRRFRNFARALAEIDVAVPQDLSTFVTTLAEPCERTVTAKHDDARRSWPSVVLRRPASAGGGSDRCASVHSELLLQLSRFRPLRCFDDADTPRQSTARVMRLADDNQHDFRVLMWDQPEQEAVFLRCINARRNYTLSCVRLPYTTLTDRERMEYAVAACINGIEQDILHDDHVIADTVFGRWVEAFKLMSQWTRHSDVAALEILEDLAKDDRGRRMGRVHAAIGSILMIQRLIVPQETDADQDRLARAREWVQKAIAVDHLEPFSHVVLGWLRVQSGDHERAVAAFEKALELNPYSGRTMIAAAEAYAFCGRLDCANALARRAVACFGPGMPADVHGYLANIAYLSGDLAECLHHLHRAPENLHSALLAVAVHQERGDEKAAAQSRVLFEQEMRRAKPEAHLDGPGLSRWIESSTMIRSPQQRERMFAALERAGVMVSTTARSNARGRQLSGR